MTKKYTFCNMQPLDARLTAAAQYLTDAGCVQLVSRQRDRADFLLFGQPGTEWDSMLEEKPPAPGTLLFARQVTAPARLAAAARDCPVVDYMQDEALLLQNAVLTAEGALALLLQAKQTALWDAGLLLLGYGRVAQALAARLAPMGARLKVAARRKEVQVLARSHGFAAADLSQLSFAGCDYLVNTVPAPILTGRELAALPDGCFLLDLASAPGGIGVEKGQLEAVSREKKLTVCTAPGLPGIIAPQTAGRLIGQTVWDFLQNEQRNAARRDQLPDGTADDGKYGQKNPMQDGKGTVREDREGRI